MGSHKNKREVIKSADSFARIYNLFLNDKSIGDWVLSLLMWFSEIEFEIEFDLVRRDWFDVWEADIKSAIE